MRVVVIQLKSAVILIKKPKPDKLKYLDKNIKNVTLILAMKTKVQYIRTYQWARVISRPFMMPQFINVCAYQNFKV